MSVCVCVFKSLFKSSVLCWEMGIKLCEITINGEKASLNVLITRHNGSSPLMCTNKLKSWYMPSPCFTLFVVRLFDLTTDANLYHFCNWALSFSVQHPSAGCLLLGWPFVSYGNNIIHLRLILQEINSSLKQGLGREISENWTTFTGRKC